MKYIKDMLNSTKKELKYQLYSKVFLITFLVIFLFAVFNLYSQMMYVKANYNLFLRSMEKYKELGIDITEALNSPAVVEKKNGLEMVDNFLRYDYDNVALSIYDLGKADRVITNTLKWLSFLVFPFIFAIYGIYVATYDIKYKTIKIKAIQKRYSQILFSKQLSMYVSSVMIISIVLLLSNIASFLFYNMVSYAIPVDNFELTTFPSDTNVMLQLILSIGITFIFITIGFYLGIIFKGFAYPAMIFTVYNFIVPNLGKYDLKNLISILGHKVFDFYGNFILFKPINVPLNMVIIILVSFVGLSTIFTYLIAERQSKYVY